MFAVAASFQPENAIHKNKQTADGQQKPDGSTFVSRKISE
jgi:hypothetical protein